MYGEDYSTENSNKFLLPIVVIVIVVAVIIIIYYFTRCGDKGDDCEEDEDCCEELTCVSKKCKEKTTVSTLTPQPSLTYCSQQNDDGSLSQWECPNGKTLIDNPSEKVYQNGNNDCCRDLTCGEWLTKEGNLCQENNLIFNNNKIRFPGYDIQTCCNDITCQDWFNGNNTCNSLTHNPLDPGHEGYDEETCCVPKTCQEWFDGNNNTCDIDSHRPLDPEHEGYDEETCCSPKLCEGWFNGNNTCNIDSHRPLDPDHEGYDEETCCVPKLCEEWFEDNDCSPQYKYMDRDHEGYNEATCCTPKLCGTWLKENDCSYFEIEKDYSDQGYDKETCCIPKNCGESYNNNPLFCPNNYILNEENIDWKPVSFNERNQEMYLEECCRVKKCADIKDMCQEGIRENYGETEIDPTNGEEYNYNLCCASKDNDEWVIGERNESCTETCENINKQCRDKWVWASHGPRDSITIDGREVDFYAPDTTDKERMIMSKEYFPYINNMSAVVRRLPVDSDSIGEIQLNDRMVSEIKDIIEDLSGEPYNLQNMLDVNGNFTVPPGTVNKFNSHHIGTYFNGLLTPFFWIDDTPVQDCGYNASNLWSCTEPRYDDESTYNILDDTGEVTGSPFRGIPGETHLKFLHNVDEHRTRVPGSEVYRNWVPDAYLNSQTPMCDSKGPGSGSNQVTRPIRRICKCGDKIEYTENYSEPLFDHNDNDISGMKGGAEGLACWQYRNCMFTSKNPGIGDWDGWPCDVEWNTISDKPREECTASDLPSTDRRRRYEQELVENERCPNGLTCKPCKYWFNRGETCDEDEIPLDPEHDGYNKATCCIPK